MSAKERQNKPQVGVPELGWTPEQVAAIAKALDPNSEEMRLAVERREEADRKLAEEGKEVIL